MRPTPGLADERSVDVDEPRDPAPATDRPRLVAAHTDLTPPKEAWAEFLRHCLGCRVCSDVDRVCATAGDLYRAWEAASDRALRRLAW
ncbi:hypothetical protein [Streptomyces sp. LKA04]|uniref:hypothetical protein n=1 Tax=Streptomyces sp. LKA04 TaxID=3398092 RepID=UPI003A7F6771